MKSTVHTSSSATTQVAFLGGTGAEYGTSSALFGPYRPLAKLGEGGMGIVYLALEEETSTLVALKVLPPRRRNEARAVARFQNEIDVTARFGHPHVVRAIEVQRPDDTPIFAMEYLDGIDLSRLMDHYGPLSISNACEIARQMALGLEHIHCCGVIHRDVKPSNALLTRSGHVKIIDMGLALIADEVTASDHPASTDQLVGSFDYMAPEQANDSHNVDRAVDLYGLGATLFQLLTGEPPFFGADFNSPMKKLMALARHEAPSVKERRPDVPDELAAIVARLLAKKPTDRYASGADLAAALAPFTNDANLTDLVSAVEICSQTPECMDRAVASTSNDCKSATIDYSR